MWRAFVYGNGQVGREDRARQAGDTFLPLDGKFDANVVVQVKNGPIDFQVREPVSPLLTGLLEHSSVMMEVQAAHAAAAPPEAQAAAASAVQLLVSQPFPSSQSEYRT